MQLKVIPDHNSGNPLHAIFIKGGDAYTWLHEIQKAGIELNTVRCFGLPGLVAGSVWGCLVVAKHRVNNIGHNQYYQNVEDILFIPQNARLFPSLHKEKIRIAFKDTRCFFHPEVGWVPLENPIDWQEVLQVVQLSDANVICPEAGVKKPQHIRTFEVSQGNPDNVLSQLTESFPEQQKLEIKPLNFFEKIKLWLLKRIFRKPDMQDASEAGRYTLSKVLSYLTGSKPSRNLEWVENLRQVYSDLEERNKGEFQKLIDLFQSDAEEALRYAVPLDAGESFRGDGGGLFQMMRQWNSFSLNSRTHYGGSTVNIENEQLQQLKAEYQKTAESLVKNGEYEKAAFVYVKLLKDTHLAATVLEQGSLYGEAAALHLKYHNDKRRAAACYEKGKMFTQAIELYNELREHEKVGDLYMLLGRVQDAHQHYNVVIESHIQSGKFVKAALLLSNKMNDRDSAQQLLLKGWKENKDAFNCLNLYFSNIDDTDLLKQEIDLRYAETNNYNYEVFLTALKHEFDKHEVLRMEIKKIAYEIVAEQAKQDPPVASMLLHFNKDKNLVKDILRFRNRPQTQ